MRKKFQLLLALVLVVSSILVPISSIGFAADEYAWVRVDVHRFDLASSFIPLANFNGTDGYFAEMTGNTIEIRGYNPNTFFKQVMDLHAKYSWTEPSKVISANGKVAIRFYQDVYSRNFGGLGVGYSPNISADTADLDLGYATASKRVPTGTYQDGTMVKKMTLAENGDPTFQDSTYADLTLDFFDKAEVGTKRAIYVTVYAGSPGSIGVRYTYEWKKVEPSDLLVQYGATPFENGVRLEWAVANGLGYRVFRSKVSNELGISITDFYIEGTSIVDVNVEPNTTYYYTIVPVLAEANPTLGTSESLGARIGFYTVKTPQTITQATGNKSVIVLQLNNKMMNVNGTISELDPGRGTMPLNISGRVMIPIKAMIEAMGGTVAWDGPTQKVTIVARGTTLEMWLNKKSIKINGQSAEMDVAPLSKNGRTYVPVSFVVNNLNAKVSWLTSTKEAIVVFE